jgi:hypothetical protein
MSACCRTTTAGRMQEANVGTEKLRLAKILQVGAIFEASLLMRHASSSIDFMAKHDHICKDAGPLLFSKRGR